MLMGVDFTTIAFFAFVLIALGGLIWWVQRAVAKILDPKENGQDEGSQHDQSENYFDLIKKNFTKNSVLVYDDINWSKGMINAWNKIKNDKDVNYSIDLYQQGIVIIDKNDPNRNINFNLHLSY